MSSICTKRTFGQVSNEGSPIPLKKRRKNLYLHTIKTRKQNFSIDKLKFNKNYSCSAVIDNLFYKPPSTKQSQYRRWVLACKFIIAANYRLDTYDVLGMNRNKIPNNMHFFIDTQNNICAVVYRNNLITKNIINHCNKIETSTIQTYYIAVNDNNIIKKMINNKYEYTYNMIDISLNTNNKYMIDIIRIPLIYYKLNMNNSFYSLCCQISNYILSNNLYSNPLFNLFLQNIANFDCFQSSVPMIPLQGSLYEMFIEYGLGIYDINKCDKLLTKNEFISFLGCYDVWLLIRKNELSRKYIYDEWKLMNETDINIIKIVIEYSDLHEMNDKRIIDYISNFNIKSINYQKYYNELLSQIPRLTSIVNFNK